jgi:hypothetical protein
MKRKIAILFSIVLMIGLVGCAGLQSNKEKGLDFGDFRSINDNVEIRQKMDEDFSAASKAAFDVLRVRQESIGKKIQKVVDKLDKEAGELDTDQYVLLICSQLYAQAHQVGIMTLDRMFFVQQIFKVKHSNKKVYLYLSAQAAANESKVAYSKVRAVMTNVESLEAKEDYLEIIQDFEDINSTMAKQWQEIFNFLVMYTAELGGGESA